MQPIAKQINRRNPLKHIIILFYFITGLTICLIVISTKQEVVKHKNTLKRKTQSASNINTGTEYKFNLLLIHQIV